MLIQHLEVQHYHVLHNFTLDFTSDTIHQEHAQSYAIDLIVGVNGTGKSTLMHLIAELFQRFSVPNQPPKFTFSITYTLQQYTQNAQTITISNKLADRQSLLKTGESLKLAAPYYLRINDEPAQLVDDIGASNLPNYVVAFSSGKQEDWEVTELFKTYNDASIDIPDENDPAYPQKLLALFQQEQAANNNSQEGATATAADTYTLTRSNRFLAIKNTHIPLIILCGLLADMPYFRTASAAKDSAPKASILQDALNEAKIKTLRGFSLVLHGSQDTLADENVQFVQRLREIASYVINYNTKNREELLFFALYADTDLATLNSQRVEEFTTVMGGNILEIFRALDQLQQPDTSEQQPILSDIHLFFERDYTLGQSRTADKPPEPTRREDRAPLHLLDWLSDGEISFLGRLCLFSLLRDSEALILLDEPEVHFNDYWKHQLVARLSHSLQNSYSHVIMTTHSSITLSDVYDTAIHVLKRNGTFTDHVEPPNLRTLGTDPSDIIMSVFGAESATGAYGTEYIQERIRAIREIKNPQERENQFTALASGIGPGPLRYLIYRERLTAQAERKPEQTQQG